ncbi:MAG: hypothetical protein ACLQVX_22495 [Limisphaerales bacterium]
MKRRTYRKLQAEQQPQHPHSVYVVLLDPAVSGIRKVRAENPKRDPQEPCVCVGMTGLAPEERFANHRAGIKAAWVVKCYGQRQSSSPSDAPAATGHHRDFPSQFVFHTSPSKKTVG